MRSHKKAWLGQKGAVAIGLLIGLMVTASVSLAVNRAGATSSAASSTPTAALTSDGYTLARFEATLHDVMAQHAVCSDNAVKASLRFVVCGSPASRYAGYVYVFRGKQAPAFTLTRTAPRPGSYGVTATPVQIRAEYLTCGPKRYVLRMYASSFLLAC
jgi:hypothetical protein